MMERIARAGDGLLSMLYPRQAVCMGCGMQWGFPRQWLCEDCRARLADRWVGAAPAQPDDLFDGAAFAYRYGGPVAGMVRNLKYRGIWRLGEMMGRDMARAFEAIQPTGVDCLVPVPMHPKRLKERGLNHARTLAEAVAKPLGLEVLDVLERTRNTPQQARLSHEERRTNLEGAISLQADLSGRRVLLVDDVRTTGATANVCTGVLRRGGAEAVYLLCYALADGDGGTYDDIGG